MTFFYIENNQLKLLKLDPYFWRLTCSIKFFRNRVEDNVDGEAMDESWPFVNHIDHNCALLNE